jgi:hypothetical protein
MSEKSNAIIETTHPVRKIPYVPSAVRGMKLVIKPVKCNGVKK